MRLALCTICYLLAAAAAQAGEPVRLSEPVTVTQTHETFGQPLDMDTEPMALGDVLDNADVFDGKTVLVRTRVAKVCQKKGCFFMAAEGAKSARITFRDYGFFIPTDSAGKTVELKGTLTRIELDQAQLEHYARDLGEADTGDAPRFEYRIVADAVRIPLS